MEKGNKGKIKKTATNRMGWKIQKQRKEQRKEGRKEGRKNHLKKKVFRKGYNNYK